MKTSSLVLAASVAANVILLGLIAIDVARPPIAPAEPAPPAAAPTPAKAPPAQTWATLTDADLAKQIELLRAEDFPPAIIRAIVGAQVRERFAARRKPLEAALANTPFWLRSRPDPATQAALRALAREEQAAVEALLGPDLENGAIASLRRQLPDFAPEKIAQLAALQQRYQEQRSEIFSQVRTGGMLPEEREKVAAIDKAMHAELAQLLTPAELEDYDLRLSNTASQLRYSLSAFNATEAEFRAIFKLQSAFDQQFGTSYRGQTPEEMRARSEAQAQLRRDIEAALGADRFADYERAQDYNYRQSTELVARLQLPPQTANTLFALQLDTQQRATALRREMGANPAASAAQLTTLAAEAEAKITALLGGARGLEAYKQYGGSWLVNLAPRTTTVPGVIKVQPPPPPSR